MKKRIFNSKGFTLVELLTVCALIVVVGVMIVAIITSSLRGSNRTNNINDIRERGTYILSQMSKMISYSKSFEGVSITGQPTDYSTDCTGAPSPDYKYLKITSFDLGETVFACTENNNIASNSSNLINYPNLTVTQCYFTCTQGGISESPQIDIHFTLSKNYTALFAENKVTIPFQTSITLRND